jgi:hypothetical protein
MSCPGLRRVLRGIHGRLIAAFLGVKWKVAPKVHSVVQNAYELDRAACCYPVHQEVTSATTVSRNVERAKTRHDLVASL